MDATVVCIDQTEKYLQAEPHAAWFRCDTRPSVEPSDQKGWTCLFVMRAEDGERFSVKRSVS
jgi:hypothetical protein